MEGEFRLKSEICDLYIQIQLNKGERRDVISQRTRISIECVGSRMPDTRWRSIGGLEVDGGNRAQRERSRVSA